MVLACIGGWLLFREGKSTPEPLAKEISTSKNITPQPAQTTPLPQPQVTIAPVTNQSAPAPAAIQQPTPPTQKKEAATPVNDVAAVSGITISGIAYQDERYMRRAVINGALVGEGAEVAGAKVVEIKENRVKFSRGGESFEVVYSSSLTR
jgi:general secretion pathway protein B